MGALITITFFGKRQPSNRIWKNPIPKSRIAYWTKPLLDVLVRHVNSKLHPLFYLKALLGLKRLHGFLEVTAAQVRSRSRFGINKWYQSFDLRNFDLEDMELESTNSGPTAKLPILKLGEYEMWAIKIKQYF
ncbi:hypothetical protein Tco_1129505 [Tanacetum coccineum]